MIEQAQLQSKSAMLKASALASFNRRSENIVVDAIVIFELTFRDVEREIFAADLVIAANDAALELRPETLNRIRVNCADNVTLSGVVDALVWVVGQAAVDAAFVGRQQADFVGNAFTHESFGISLVHRLQDTGDDVALAAYRTDDRCLGGRRMFATTSALIPMLVLVLAANESFVDFDDTAEFRFWLNQGGADFVAHAPRGFIRAEAHKAHDLERGHSLFARQHEVSDLEPVAERLVRVLEDRTRDMGESVGGLRRTSVAVPMPAILEFSDLCRATAGAMDAIGPAAGDQVVPAGFLIGESRLELGVGHLVDWFRTAGNRTLPDYGRKIAC